MSLEVASLRALAHPVRLRMLSLLTGAELNATEVSRELGITQANASYHLRTLLRAGLLEEAGRERVRGGVAKRYRHPFAKQPPLRRDAAGKRLYAEALAAELVRRSAAQAEGRATTTDAELWVSPPEYERALDLVVEASELLHAGARPPRTEGTVRVSMTAALFRMGSDS